MGEVRAPPEAIECSQEINTTPFLSKKRVFQNEGEGILGVWGEDVICIPFKNPSVAKPEMRESLGVWGGEAAQEETEAGTPFRGFC